MPNGGTLSISTENTELSLEYAREHPDVKPGLYVMLTVSDTGCGMTNEVREHIFEPFFTTKGKDKGSGLGLSTVYGIVKQSNGHINVYTEVGHGTTFRIYFPIAQSSAADIQFDELKTPSAEKGSETILVVEDESGVRDLVVDVLESAGYTVLAASDGEKAEKLCQKHPSPIHLLITDMVLPRMSGRDVAVKCSQYHSKAKVLFMSGYTDDVIFHSGALDPGMAFIEKPFTPDTFLRKVREVLNT
jgi:two-component system cell cycle sensor histidine kinase/response regulator CckA